MQQRKPASGRPSGTDGHDYRFRMIVESRYQRVAQGKSRLSALIFAQAIIQIIGVLYIVLWASWQEGPDRIAISSIVVGWISLILGELGRRRSRANLLKLYMVGSSLAIFLSIICVAKGNLTLEVIQDPRNWEANKFELLETSRVLLGFLIQIFTISTVISLVRDMSPPKKAS
ncbi:Protein jagunal [Parasponia andersonii]|uniref:Protein jagunal n=1 Tax=Parasponia andersonii TaxID=3476 RepID=A0A2P5C5H1_PARAD|nr:Protein jagunal [Parasponia andersonii]